MEGLNIFDAVVTFVVGILSSLATHYLLRRKGPASPNGPVLNIVVVWSTLPVVFVMVCLLFVQYRWPVSVPIGVTLVVGSFLVAAGVLVGVKFLSQLIRWSSRQEMAALLAAGCLVVGAYFQILDQSLPHGVALNRPAKVSEITPLRGRVVNPRLRVYVLVWPRASNTAWVVRAIPPGADGVWHATCTFGGTVGDWFEVYAVAIPPDVVRVIDVGEPAPEPKVLEDAARFRTAILSLTIEE